MDSEYLNHIISFLLGLASIILININHLSFETEEALKKFFHAFGFKKKRKKFFSRVLCLSQEQRDNGLGISKSHNIILIGSGIDYPYKYQSFIIRNRRSFKKIFSRIRLQKK